MPFTTFNSDLKVGQQAEQLVYDYYIDKFDSIEKASLAQEKEFGYDFIFYYKSQSFTVEVKNDAKSSQTGNIFIELSVDSASGSNLGWAEKTQADIIMIHAGRGSTEGLYLTKNHDLKSALPQWKEDYTIRKTISSQSNGHQWHAKGLPVPITEFGKHCFKFIPEDELKKV